MKTIKIDFIFIDLVLYIASKAACKSILAVVNEKAL
jgi:hypothetical protein